MTEQSAPAATKRHHFRVRYYIVNDFGDIRWEGQATISQDGPWPTGPRDLALIEAQTAQTIRSSTPPEAPPGRVLIACVFPI